MLVAGECQRICFKKLRAFSSSLLVLMLTSRPLIVVYNKKAIIYKDEYFDIHKNMLGNCVARIGII